MSSTAQDPVRQRRKQCFADNVRMLIRTGSLGVGQLATSLGISERTIWRWQAEGSAHPDKRTKKTLQKLCEQFGVKVEDLWDRDLPEKTKQRCEAAEHLAERVRAIFSESEFEVKYDLARLIQLNYFMSKQHRLKTLIERNSEIAVAHEREAEEYRKKFQDEKMLSRLQWARPWRQYVEKYEAELADVEIQIRKYMTQEATAEATSG